MKTALTAPLWIIAASLCLIPTRPNACSCIELSPCEACGYSSAVFIGQMLEGTEKAAEYTREGKTTIYEAGAVRFAVQESFKGVSATQVTIFVLNMKGTS